MEIYSQVVIAGLISSAPYLVGWIVAVVLAVIMLGRGGARAERFLLVGASLMLLGSVLDIPTSALSVCLHVAREMTATQTAFWLSIYGIIRGIVSLAGIVLLVYAFWAKFRRGK